MLTLATIVTTTTRMTMKGKEEVVVVKEEEEEGRKGGGRRGRKEGEKGVRLRGSTAVPALLAGANRCSWRRRR